MKALENSLLGEQTPGWERLCRASKTLQWSRAGTRGQGDPVERSQRMEEDPEGIEITWREVLEIREDVSGQDCCMRESS